MIGVIIVVIALVVGAVMTALGFRAAPTRGAYRPHASVAPRYFAQAPPAVAAAYRSAAGQTPGMRIVPAAADELYLDCRPSARILSGDFGVAMLVRFQPHTSGTVVLVDAQAKTLGLKAATLAELERAVRMRAKAYGLTELSV